MEQGPPSTKKRPKLLPLLYLNRERFNSFEGSFIISFVRWLMTSYHPLEFGRSHYRAALHSWCVQAITAVPTLLDKVCEESRTSIEVVHLLLEMTTFLEELPSSTCVDKCPLSGAIIPLMPPCINNPMSKTVFTKKFQQPKLLIVTLRLWTSRIRCFAQLWA
jgi:hypothetical protein